jgi:hypothetical protein
MPLLDHFHPPLSEERSWEGFHAAWAATLAEDLNQRLPPGYFAEPLTHGGTGVEIDVPTWDTRPAGTSATGPTTTLAAPTLWAPPTPMRTIPAVFSDDIEIRVISTLSGPRLVAAIELVSPRNKDRQDARQAFAVKCVSYLHQGVSLLVVDVVTERHANLHELIMTLLPGSGGSLFPAETRLYAVAHRPVRREGQEQIDLWGQRLEVGQALPTLPLAISAEVCLPIDLESTYQDTRKKARLDNGPG